MRQNFNYFLGNTLHFSYCTGAWNQALFQATLLSVRWTSGSVHSVCLLLGPTSVIGYVIGDCTRHQHTRTGFCSDKERTRFHFQGLGSAAIDPAKSCIPIAACRWRSSRGSPVTRSCMFGLHLLPLLLLCLLMCVVDPISYMKQEGAIPSRWRSSLISSARTLLELWQHPLLRDSSPIRPLCFNVPHLLHDLSYTLFWCGVDLIDW